MRSVSTLTVCCDTWAGVNEPVSAGDEGSVSNGGAGETSQQRNEGEVKEDDGHQKQEESNRPDTSVKRAKSPSTCKFISHVPKLQYTFITL